MRLGALDSSGFAAISPVTALICIDFKAHFCQDEVLEWHSRMSNMGLVPRLGQHRNWQELRAAGITARSSREKANVTRQVTGYFWVYETYRLYRSAAPEVKPPISQSNHQREATPPKFFRPVRFGERDGAARS